MSIFDRLMSVHLNLRLKVVLPIALILIVNMLLIGIYLVQRQSDDIMQELRTNARTITQMFALNCESGVLFESKFQLDEELRVLNHLEGAEFAVVYNLGGEILAQMGVKESNPNYVPIDSLRGLLAQGGQVEYLATNFDTEVLILAQPITLERKTLNRETLGITGGIDNTTVQGNQLETIGFIEIGLSVETVRKNIIDATTATIVITAVGLVLTIFLIILIVNTIARPLSELAWMTNKIARGDFSQKLEIDRKDEIGQLAETFNQMVGSLKQSRDEIEQYNRNLEEKIIERTQQLEEAQAQLVQSEKLSAIGQLAAGVAHELNNPLGGILGYAQFTLEKLSKNVPEQTTAKEVEAYVRYVGDIETQARRCKTIVQNLLRFSRSSQGVEMEEVDINAAIKDTISFVEHQLRLHQITLETDLDLSLPKIQGNVGQLQQVFTNLIINGMHASEPNSIFRIESHYSPALGEFGGAVELKFIDYGCGIKGEDLKKIFEPFFTTKEIGKGTGLGLSVSYGIIKAHQGEINVASEVSKGTTFTIVLPVQKTVVLADSHIEKQ